MGAVFSTPMSDISRACYGTFRSRGAKRIRQMATRSARYVTNLGCFIAPVRSSTYS